MNYRGPDPHAAGEYSVPDRQSLSRAAGLCCVVIAVVCSTPRTGYAQLVPLDSETVRRGEAADTAQFARVRECALSPTPLTGVNDTELSAFLDVAIDRSQARDLDFAAARAILIVAGRIDTARRVLARPPRRGLLSTVAPSERTQLIARGLVSRLASMPGAATEEECTWLARSVLPLLDRDVEPGAGFAAIADGWIRRSAACHDHITVRTQFAELSALQGLAEVNRLCATVPVGNRGGDCDIARARAGDGAAWNRLVRALNHARAENWLTASAKIAAVGTAAPLSDLLGLLRSTRTIRLSGFSLATDTDDSDACHNYMSSIPIGSLVAELMIRTWKLEPSFEANPGTVFTREMLREIAALVRAKARVSHRLPSTGT